MFGNSFGQSAIAQPATPSSFGGFGSMNTNASLFATPQPLSFGTTATVPTFGQPNQPTGFNFGASTNTPLFGQSQPATPFGVMNTTPCLFNSTPSFGRTTDFKGTVVKFTPVVGTDTTLNRGIAQKIHTIHYCISAMKEYENKSPEELRFEDYVEGRKGIPSEFFSATYHTAFPATNSGTRTGALSTLTQPRDFFNNQLTGFNMNNPNSIFFAPTTFSPFNTNKQLEITSTPLFSKNAPTLSTGSMFNSKISQNTAVGPFSTTQPSLLNQNKSAFNFKSPLSSGFTTNINSFSKSTQTGFTPCNPKSAFCPFITNQNLFKTSFQPVRQSNLNTTSGTSLFNQQKPGNLFGPGFSTFNTGLGINQNKQIISSAPIHDQILALITTPFGDSPLLKNILPASGKAESLEKLKSAFILSKPIKRTQYKISTNNSLKIKPKITTSFRLSQNLLFDNFEEDPYLADAFQIRPSAKRLVLRPKPTPNMSQTVENAASDASKSSTSSCKDSSTIDKENQASQTIDSDSRSSSTSWLKSSINRKKLQEDDTDGRQSSFQDSDVFSETLDNTIRELMPSLTSQNPASVSSIDLVDSSDSIDRSSDSDETLESSSQSATIAKLAQVKLTRKDYYTVPPLEKLDEYVCAETCFVPNFTIGRKEYGSVYFKGPIDIFGLDLDEIVHFRHKEVIIYPNDDNKPPIGQGLNRKAEVTLDRVWPKDKSQSEPIMDAKYLEEIDYVEKLIRICEKHSTQFVEYRSESGSCVFKVDHF